MTDRRPQKSVWKLTDGRFALVKERHSAMQAGQPITQVQKSSVIPPFSLPVRSRILQRFVGDFASEDHLSSVWSNQMVVSVIGVIFSLATLIKDHLVASALIWIIGGLNELGRQWRGTPLRERRIPPSPVCPPLCVPLN